MKDLLIEAHAEITRLRHRNEILSAKVEMIDLFATVLNTAPSYPSQGYAEDVAWKLQRKIDSLDQEKAESSALSSADKADLG